jgi:hypothetical protein
MDLYEGYLGMCPILSPLAVIVCGGITFNFRPHDEFPDLGFPNPSPWRRGFFYLKETMLEDQVVIPPCSHDLSRPRNLSATPQVEDMEVIGDMRNLLHGLMHDATLEARFLSLDGSIGESPHCS